MTSKSNSDLLNELKLKVARERDLLIEIIWMLEEVDRRRLFLEMGYGSLLEFCVKELNYSESAAYRRISAMRVVRDVPETAKKIESGELTLAVVTQAQTFFRTEEKEKGMKLGETEKSKVLKMLTGTSSRQAEKILLEMAPDRVRPEIVRAVTPTESEVRMTLSEESLRKLAHLKGLLAHKLPNATYAEIIDESATLALRKLDPPGQNQMRAATSVKRAAKPTPGFESRHCSQARRHISSQLRRLVWQQAQGQCCYTNPKTKLRCSSRYQLEIDHIIPLAHGGSSSPSNLQLLCRAHNSFKGAHI